MTRPFTRPRMGFAQHSIPPTRLCECSHIYAVHSRGFCGVCRRRGLPECEEFAEDHRVPVLLPDLPFLSGAEVHRRHLKRPA